MSVLQQGVIFLNKYQARKAVDEYGENNLFRPTIKRSANSFKISCNYKGCPFKCLMCKHKDDKVKCTLLLEKHVHSIGDIPVERKRCSCILTHKTLVNKITPILMANPKATAKDLKMFLLSEGYEVPSSTIYSVKREIIDKMPKIISENEPVNKILKALDKTHPIKLCEDDDNVGLILEPSQLLIKPPYKLLLTYEINDSVVNEAIHNKVYIIVSYKPLIKTDIKKLNYEDRIGRIILNCITNGIGIYIHHTSCDNVVNGVNDWLTIGIGGINPKPIEPNQLEIDCGCGRICDIIPDISIDDLVNRIKQYYGINYIQIAKPPNDLRRVSKIAICSGESKYRIFQYIHADVLITDELSHTEILDITSKGSYIILLGNIKERHYFNHFKEKLNIELGIDYPVLISYVNDYDEVLV